MKILKDANPILRQISKEVVFPLSDKVKNIADEMIKHIKKSKNSNNEFRQGVGIAAVQIGHLLRMFYVNLENFEEFLINPIIVSEGVTYAALESGEGCLSVDEKNRNDLKGLVHRKLKITIRGYSYLQNKEIEITKSRYEAIVIQHEMDHLNGKIFYDRIDQKNKWTMKPNEEII